MNHYFLPALVVILIASFSSCRHTTESYKEIKKNTADRVALISQSVADSLDAQIEYLMYPRNVDSAIVELDHVSYKYIQSYYPGGSMGNFDVGFSLKNLQSMEVFTLAYTYQSPRKANGLLSETLDRSKNLTRYSTLDSFLIEKASSGKGGFKKKELLRVKASVGQFDSTY